MKSAPRIEFGSGRIVPLVATCLAVVMTLVLSATARADDLPEQGARLAPADVAAFIEVENLAQLRAELERDPLIQYLEEHMPERRHPEAWEAIQQALDMSGEEVFDRFFGQRVVILGQTTEQGGPGIILSRIADADARLAVERLGLQRDAQRGVFTVYRTADNLGRLAFAEGWMAFTEARHADFLTATLERLGDADALADDADYQQWMQKVGGDQPSVARAFVRDAAKDEVHALALHRDPQQRLDLHYAGRNDDTAELLSRLGDADALDFGPLPRGVIAATTFNLRDTDGDSDLAELMDRLMTNASFADDVQPHLKAPLVTFLAEVKGENLDPAAGFSTPVLGFAIKLDDPAVAEKIDNALQSVVMFANLATMQAQVDRIELYTERHEGMTFRYADAGRALAQQLDEPGLRGAAHLAFGGVGDWYVVTTHARVFREVIDAQLHDSARLQPAEQLEHLRLDDDAQPVATTFLRAQPLAAHMRTWVAHLAERQPGWFEDAQDKEPDTQAGRIIRGINVAAGVLEFFEGYSLQLYADGDDPQILRAHGVLQRQ